MKKLALGLVLGLAVAAGIAMKANELELKKGYAEVEQEQGIHFYQK